MPAKAGIQLGHSAPHQNWIPACAGMTCVCRDFLISNEAQPRAFLVSPLPSGEGLFANGLSLLANQEGFKKRFGHQTWQLPSSTIAPANAGKQRV
ncbi:MAG: hypothetical protein Q8M37_14620 [Nevskia sp.]|nr:hypothetical protein [Nevskia sp.]